MNETAPPAGLQGDPVDIEPHVRRLQQFQLEILRVFKEAFSEATGSRPEELSTWSEMQPILPGFYN